MWQKHSIILWKKAEDVDSSFEEIASEAYEVFSAMQKFPPKFRPTYLTAKSKKSARETDWDRVQFCNELAKKVNREGRKSFEALGYTISFFSSMTEVDSCSIKMTVGNKVPQFYNTLIVDFPFSFDTYNTESVKAVYAMFETLVKCFRPFWGCVSNAQFSRQFGGFCADGIPTTVHWINYWSPEIVNSIGEIKIQDALRELPDAALNDGILIVKNSPFDIESEDSIAYQQLCHKTLLEV